VQEIGKTPLAAVHQMPPSSPHGRNIPVKKDGISVATAKDGISIAELYARRENYANKLTKVRGQVTKFNANIMGKNWVHLQDGTNDSGNYDLTIATSDMVKVGEVVTFEGKVTLKKNFGAGYFYEVILEDGKKLDDAM
jgi:hypothetical protein